ncbi:NMT1/THI5 like domain-containing protein [Ochromonadaceae sp. CCMP2298]|nr:NMT1/THI5 like domain-containing protein [Ochromonadaceae sp. CCMP2298]
MKKLRIALDWTPNTNHTGFYVGVAKGWYEAAGIDLEIVPPSDLYLTGETPARQVVNGCVNFCIAPSESAVSCWTSDAGNVRPVAVAAILQTDTSAIVTRADSGITSPAQLDGKIYASYQGRFEMPIVQQMIKQAGGKGVAVETAPPKLDCFDAVMRGDADATWVFMAWEGVIAEMKGVKLNAFDLKSSSVPYGYSPVLLAHPDMVQDESLAAFLRVTQEGFKFATEQPAEAALLLMETAQHPSLAALGLHMLVKSQRFLSEGGHYLDGMGKWGTMDSERVKEFLDWLAANELLRYRDDSVVPR